MILPSRLKPLVFKKLHVDMGHAYIGYNRTLELMKERFFWPKTYDDVKYFVTKICKCIKDQIPNALPEAPLKTITFSPMELMIITDYFTRYTQVYPTSNKEAKTAATRLFNDFFLRFWTPGKIFHDQGREFENKLFTHLSELCNIKRLCTAPYHPKCNGQVERMNKLIIAILKTLEKTEKKYGKIIFKK